MRLKKRSFFELILALFFAASRRLCSTRLFKSQKSLNQSVKALKAVTMPKIILTFMLVISLYGAPRFSGM